MCGYRYEKYRNENLNITIDKKGGKFYDESEDIS